MAKLKEIAYNIRLLVRGGILSDDERIQEEQVYFIIAYVRSLFIKQMVDKNQPIPYSLMQKKCMTLGLVDKSCCPDIKTNCLILRSTEDLPEIIRTNYGLALGDVTSLDGNESYGIIPSARSRSSRYNKYIGNEKKIFFQGARLFMLNDVYQEKLCLEAVFANPLTVDADETLCFIMGEKDYPLPNDMVGPITDYIVNNILRLSLLVNSDEINDSNGKVANSFRTTNAQNTAQENTP